MDLLSYKLGKAQGGGSPTLQSKSVTITENGNTTISADSGYDGLSQVNVTTNVSSGGNYNVKVDTSKNYAAANTQGFRTLVTEVANIDTSSYTSLQYFFANCWNLTTIPLLNTSNATNMKSMFTDCYKLQSIPLIDTSNVTNMQSMFYNCYNSGFTTIPLLNTSSVTTMQYMFGGCTKFTTLPLLDTSNVTDMSNMFNGCSKITNIPLLNTSSVTNMSGMFNNDGGYLTDDSLNNILAMCIGAASYTGVKTLRAIGIYHSNYSNSRIQALSNYQDFIAAGWTTGN